MPGWTSLTLLVVMISSVQLLVLGLIGEYRRPHLDSIEDRPLFLISHIQRHGRLPHGAADGRDDLEQVPLMTLLAQSESTMRSGMYAESFLMKAMILSHPPSIRPIRAPAASSAPASRRSRIT